MPPQPSVSKSAAVIREEIVPGLRRAGHSEYADAVEVVLSALVQLHTVAACGHEARFEAPGGCLWCSYNAEVAESSLLDRATQELASFVCGKHMFPCAIDGCHICAALRTVEDLIAPIEVETPAAPPRRYSMPDGGIGQRQPRNPSEASFFAAAKEAGLGIVSKRGWPDFFCVGDKGIALVEVKPTADHPLKREQEMVMRTLARYGVPCWRWSPDAGFTRITGEP